MIVWTRIFSFLMSSFLCCHAGADAAADVIKSMSVNPKVKLAHKLGAFNGQLLGFDGGEWGGALIFLDNQGRATRLNERNIQGLVVSDGHVLAFSGLTHLGVNEGEITELIQMADGSLSERVLVDLQGEPSALERLNEQTIAFKVFSGFDSEGKMAYACKTISHGAVSNWFGCNQTSGDAH